MMESLEKQRSRIMRAVKSKNTTPEIFVRKILFSMGYRYRLHCADLPGKPDLIFPKQRKIIFIHGCFWHGHNCARGARLPRQNSDYWAKKINRNIQRDKINLAKLRELNWNSLLIWECQLKNVSTLKVLLSKFLT